MSRIAVGTKQPEWRPSILVQGGVDDAQVVLQVLCVLDEEESSFVQCSIDADAGDAVYSRSGVLLR